MEMKAGTLCKTKLGIFFITFLVLILTLNLFDCSVAFAGIPNEPDQGATVRPGNLTAPAGNLIYRGGPIVKGNHTTYTIFWIPSGYNVSPRYQSLINTFLGDVAADSGKNTNVYSSVTQYGDGLGVNVYQSSFGGTILITTPFPGSNCSLAGFTVCLTDAQIQLQLNTVIDQQGLATGMDKLFFIFLPKNVGSCYSGSNTFCVYNNYCAYHNSYARNNSTILYATMPYAMGNQSKCGSNSHPNGDDADSTINLLAHEHGELITDPTHSAWIDDAGKERGDRCVWQFGQTLGWTIYGKYNQLINGKKYYLQSQWSNQTNRCVLSGL